MVRVEAPPAEELPSAWPIEAFKNLAASNPLCWKNLEYSVATKASTNVWGKSSYVTKTLFSLPSLVISFPSLSYKTVASFLYNCFVLKSGAVIII